MDPARLPLLMDLIAIETYALRLARQQPSQHDLQEILTLVREVLDREMGHERPRLSLANPHQFDAQPKPARHC
jgi:hypothetical protein